MKNVAILTGGSGGHVIPALNIYDHLKKTSNIKLISDGRGKKYIDDKQYNLKIINVPNIFSDLYLFPFKFFAFFISIIQSYSYLKKKKVQYCNKYWRIYDNSFLYSFTFLQSGYFPF